MQLKDVITDLPPHTAVFKHLLHKYYEELEEALDPDFLKKLRVSRDHAYRVIYFDLASLGIDKEYTENEARFYIVLNPFNPLKIEDVVSIFDPINGKKVNLYIYNMKIAPNIKNFRP